MPCVERYFFRHEDLSFTSVALRILVTLEGGELGENILSGFGDGHDDDGVKWVKV